MLRRLALPSVSPQASRVARAVLPAALALGCSVTPTGAVADADTGSVHALLVVEHDERADGAVSAALAAFVRVAPAVDPAAAAALFAPTHELPALGTCRRAATPAAEPGGTVQLLEAGDVELLGDADAVVLAPRVLPTVGDLGAGLIYVSPDRSAAGAPAAATVLLRSAGGTEVPAVEVEAALPPAVEGIRLDGTPWEALEALTPRGALRVDWVPGGASDTIAVLATAGAVSIVCATADAGSAVLPLSEAGLEGEGEVSVRRLRQAELSAPALDGAALRASAGRTTRVVWRR